MAKGRTVLVRMDNEQLERLDALVGEYGTSRSDVIRKLIEAAPDRRGEYPARSGVVSSGVVPYEVDEHGDVWLDLPRPN